MLNRFARDAAIYGSAHVVSRITTFALLPVFARWLAPEDFGAVDLTLALSAFALVTVALEIGQGLARDYPDASNAADRAKLSGGALFVGGVAYLTFAGVAFVVLGVFGRDVLGRADGIAIVAAGAAWVCSMGMLAIAQIPLRFGLRPRAYALSNIVMALLSGVTGIAMVVGLKWGPAGLLAGQAAGAAVAFVVSVRLIDPAPRLRPVGPAIMSMLRFSLPLVPASIAVVATGWADRLALGALASLDELGQYAVGVRIAAVVGIAVTATQAAIVPLAYTHHADPETPTALVRLARVYIVAGLLLLAILAVAGPAVVFVMAGPAYSSAATVLPLLGLTPLLAGFANFAPGLAIARATRIMAGIAVGGAAAAVALCVILIPVAGILGAAGAAAAASGLAAVVTITAGQRYYGLPWPVRRLLLAVATAVAIAVTPTVASAVAGVAASGTVLVLVSALLVVAGLGVMRTPWGITATRGSLP